MVGCPREAGSAVGLQQLDAAKYTEENVLDPDQKNQLFKSLKEILEDRETWESAAAQQWSKQ